MQEITARELKTMLDKGETVQLIDVRQPDEHAFASIQGSELIPMGEIMSRTDELDPQREAIIYCKSGMRSARVIDALERSGYSGTLKNLAGGILSWSRDVDPSVPTY